jgi:hypothetical protein
VADDKPPVEKAVELFVYAPVGAALYVRDMLPGMMGIFVARGKREVRSHIPGAPPPPPAPPVPPEVKRRIDDSVGMARTVAEGGLGVAREVAGTGFGVARDVAGSALSQFLAMRANGDPTPPPGGAPGAPAPTDPTAPAAAPTPSPAAEPTMPPETTWRADVPAAESLPIPDYDELSASQVVERLEGLDRASLEAIRTYEASHRGRNTILGKIAQLG